MGAVGYGVFASQNWEVSHTVVADGDVVDVIDYVRDVEAWRYWAVVGLVDPLESEFLVGEVRKGPGATLSWTGGGAAGGVELVAEDAHSVVYLLSRSGRPAAAVYEGDVPTPTASFVSAGSVRAEAHPDGVAITWSDEGTVGIRPIGPFLLPSVRASVEEDVQAGLEALAGEVERKAALRRRLQAVGVP